MNAPLRANAWTPRQDDVVRTYPGLTDEALGDRLGKSAGAVAMRRLALGLRRNKVYTKGGGWTEDRVETVRRLWADGQSAAQIAGHLGPGFTRNAVIGKLSRLGLTQKGGGRGVSPRTAQREINQKPQRAASAGPTHAGNVVPLINKVAPTLAVRMGAPGAGAKPIGRRRTFECAWPLEDIAKDADASTPFCCAPVKDGSSFCPVHHARAYRPVKEGVESFARSLRRYV